MGGAKRILIATKEHPDFDEVASALALCLFFATQKLERVDVVAPIAEERRNRFKFLPGFDTMRYAIAAADRFVIRLNLKETKAKELRYDVVGDSLEIHIKPEGGTFSAKDVSFSQSDFAYDLIFVIGAINLPGLGPVFENNRDLFFNTPVVNIDRRPANVRFGTVNVVYATATSIAEVVHEFVRQSVTKDIATCLLTGLISATNSFQSPQVTPDTLRFAGELLVAGAPREEIINHLYRTKDMEKLRLWGRVLARLRQFDTRIVYSRLTAEEGGAGEIDLPGLVDDLVLTNPEAHVVLFFYGAAPEETRVAAFARENYDLMVLLNAYAPKGDRAHASFTVAKPLEETEIEVLERVRNQLRLINR